MSRINERRLQLEQDLGAEHLYASRVRVYPKAVRGPMRRLKWAVLAFCLTVYYLLPWLRWYRGPGRPDQAVLLDVAQQRYYFFNLEFWPQDIYYLTGLLIVAAVALFLVTSLFGRVWCGYSCPQTVWTDLFMWVEREIEGDRNERMKRDAGPANFDKVWRKLAKHAAWLGFAFWTGGAFIMYFADAPTITRAFWTGTAPVPVYFFTGLFTFTTYALAGWAREQVCTYMCPWPRFQSAMLDDQSLTVTYQAWRGEPRSRGKRGPGTPAAGDCVDCAACYTACPTGIDIRDGIQLECINCGLCVDACNHVMAVTGQKPWLITWDTLADQKAKQEGRAATFRWFRPRTAIYLGALVVAASAMAAALATRTTIALAVQHDRAPVFVPLPDGGVRNGYAIEITNRTEAPAVFSLSLRGLPGALLADATTPNVRLPGLGLPVGPDRIADFRVLVTARPTALPDGRVPLDFVLRDTATGVETVYHGAFIGPQSYSGGGP
ncbi:MAG TPA: cytochrome c oxidase accessory protein CcoG [Acetobacteraceae bacterium]|nr:cytochrome c oxidase accessory protein CcoG [Acetobacteraceae bacterium]